MKGRYLSFSSCFLLLQLGLTFQATSAFGEENVTSSDVIVQRDEVGTHVGGEQAVVTGTEKTNGTTAEEKAKVETETRDKRQIYNNYAEGEGEGEEEAYTYGGGDASYAEEQYEAPPVPEEETSYAESEPAEPEYGEEATTDTYYEESAQGNYDNQYNNGADEDGEDTYAPDQAAYDEGQDSMIAYGQDDEYGSYARVEGATIDSAGATTDATTTPSPATGATTDTTGSTTVTDPTAPTPTDPASTAATDLVASLVAGEQRALGSYDMAQAYNKQYNKGSYKSAAASSSYKSSTSYQQNQGAYQTSSYTKPLPYKSNYQAPTAPVYTPVHKEPYPVRKYAPEPVPQYGGGYDEEAQVTDEYATTYEQPAEPTQYVDNDQDVDYTVPAAPSYSYGDANEPAYVPPEYSEAPADTDDGTYNGGYEQPAAYEEEQAYVPKKKPVPPKNQYPATGNKGYGNDYDPCKKKKYPETPAAGKYKDNKKPKYISKSAEYPSAKPDYKKVKPAKPPLPQYTKMPPAAPQYRPENKYQEEEKEYRAQPSYDAESDYAAPVYKDKKVEGYKKQGEQYTAGSYGIPKPPAAKKEMSKQAGTGRSFFPAFGGLGGGFGAGGFAAGGSATTLIVDDSGSRRSRRRSRSRRSRSSRGRNEDRETIRDLQAQLAALQRRDERERDRRQQAETARDNAQAERRRLQRELNAVRANRQLWITYANCLRQALDNQRAAVTTALAGAAAGRVARVNAALAANNGANCVQPAT